MRLSRNLRFVVLSILLSSFTIPGALAQTGSAQTQDASVALQRGFRTGYSDGYMGGYRDTIDSLARNYSRHAEYTKADRAFNKDYGSVEDYRDGYQQGFESGYETGYDRRSFEASLPAGLKRRGLITAGEQIASTTTVGNTVQTDTENVDTTKSEQTSSIGEPITTTGYQGNGNAVVIIPRDTELIIELQDDLNTQQSREGQKFTAKIVSPSEIAGATVEGRVSKIRQPGRLKRRSELLLSFDRIILNENRWSNFSGTLTEVMAVKGDNVQRVDVEGTAVGKSSLKQDAIKVGGATGAGLVIGGVVGGPVGAAVGAGMGAAFGVGAVVIERGKHVRLNRNQQLRIKTAYETQIR
jgi:hypothetical protein